MKSTKKALFTSVLSLLLCVSMLIGTTFAWFTDSVTSGVNQIIAGNLDVELYYALESDYNGASTNWTKVGNTTKLFNAEGTALWEPGYTETVYLKVVNEGSLALNYKFSVDVISEVGSISMKDGSQFKLSDHLVFGLTEGSATAPTKYATREAVWAAIGDTKGNIGDLISAGATLREDLAAGGEQYFTMAVYMPTTVGNEANYATGYNAPEIDFGLTLLASQAMHENDSFGNTYDTDALFPSSSFIPSTDVIYPVVVEVTSAEAGAVTVSKTESDVLVAEATVSGVVVGDKLNMIAKPTNNTTANFTLESDQIFKTYEIVVTKNGEKQTNVPFQFFVGTGLSNVLLYHANDTDPIASTYDPVSGLLSFTAPSFSEYHVVNDQPTYVAMVGGSYYATLRDAVNAMSAANRKFALLDETAWDAATPVYWQTATKSGMSATMKLATDAAHAVNDGAITILCRPGAEVGTMSHVDVAENLTVFGNGAKVVPGGDQDFAVDTYKYLTKDITLNIFNLDNIAVWGQRNTENKLTINMMDCHNVNRIYFSSAKGQIDINVANCSFDGANGSHKNTSIKTDSMGTWNISNTSFKDIAVAVALTNENGSATLNISNCSFTNVATKTNAAAVNAADYASPIRVLGRAATTVTVDKASFSYTDSNEKNFEDIVIGEVRSNKAAGKAVDYTVRNTVGTLLSVESHKEGVDIDAISTKIVLDGSEVVGTNAPTISDEPDYTVNTTEALVQLFKDSSLTDGAVIGISGTVSLKDLNLSRKNVTLVGQEGGSVIDVGNGTLTAAGSVITMKNMEVQIAHSPGLNYTQGIQHAAQERYIGCTFNGQLSTMTSNVYYEGCTFNGSASDDYSLWIYAGTVTAKDCTFNPSKKGIIKLYAEKGNVANITMDGCTFNGNSSVSKGAIFASNTNNVTVNGDTNTYNGKNYVVTATNCTFADGLPIVKQGGTTSYTDHRLVLSDITVNGVSYKSTDYVETGKNVVVYFPETNTIQTIS